MEEALEQWFAAVLEKGVRISGPILKSKAEELAQKLSRTDFVATDGWLSRWKSRKSIKFKRTHGEKSSEDVEGAEEWISTVLPQLLHQYQPENVYCMLSSELLTIIITRKMYDDIITIFCTIGSAA